MPYQVLNTCTLCGACLPECPTGSIVAGAAQVYIDTDTCADHAACVAVCPVHAIIPAGSTSKGGTQKSSSEKDKGR